MDASTSSSRLAGAMASATAALDSASLCLACASARAALDASSSLRRSISTPSEDAGDSPAVTVAASVSAVCVPSAAVAAAAATPSVFQKMPSSFKFWLLEQSFRTSRSCSSGLMPPPPTCAVNSCASLGAPESETEGRPDDGEPSGGEGSAPPTAYGTGERRVPPSSSARSRRISSSKTAI